MSKSLLARWLQDLLGSLFMQTLMTAGKDVCRFHLNPSRRSANFCRSAGRNACISNTITDPDRGTPVHVVHAMDESALIVLKQIT